MDKSNAILYTLKNVPLGILLCIFFGPLGLLYGSIKGSIIMILIGIVILSFPYPFPIILWWVMCAVWCAYAIEKHNTKQLRLLMELKGN